jgi:small subunit ribosomal protein S8
MVNDPIGDLLIQIKNASMASKRAIDVPYSKLKDAVAIILQKEGYVGSVTRVGEVPNAMLHIEIKYNETEPVITGVKRISKPGLRLYVTKREIPVVVGGMGTSIISTPQGVMTGKEAKKRGIGGEVMCTIW